MREGAKDKWASATHWDEVENARQREFCTVLADLIEMDVDRLKGLTDED